MKNLVKTLIVFFANKVKDIISNIIINIVVKPFQYILVSHGLVSALCFAICMILIGYTILSYSLSYSNNRTISNREIEAIQQAANTGNVGALKKLGDMYFYGVGLKQDYKKAFMYYMQSAEQGNAEAQYQIGQMYYEGKGVSVNYHKAYLYYSISNINGNPSAYLDGMYWIRKRKLIPVTEIADITVEAQNIAKRMRKD